ncbi:MAG: DNA recombination protein RmuC [Nocardiopsaceae bacterium]|nr:DNA recombination protein RmuC [Nocardiopsaceae bacterium]
MVILALVAGIVIGAVIGYLLARTRLTAATATAEARARAAEEKAALLDRAQAEKQELLSGQLSERFDVEALMGPMRDTLTRVEQQLRDSDTARTRSHAELAQQVEFTRRGAEQLRDAAAALTTALRRPEARGRWGELQLRRVVELAGMSAHCDFSEQVVLDGGTQRPDMVVRLAGGKNLVVDSKVPLAGYLEAVEAVSEADREARLRAHARHLRTHVEQLGSKTYWKALPSAPEFVILFIPGEAFLAPALEADPGLLEYALARRVHIATPTTLVSMLRTASYAWQQQALSENARAVFDLGRELHDRLASLGKHVDRLGRSLTSAVGAYNQAVGSLENRVLVTARRLSDLGVVDGHLDEPAPLTETPRPLAAAELVTARLPEAPVNGHELATAEPEP